MREGSVPPAVTAAARLLTDAETARRLFEAAGALFPADELAVSCFEDKDGHWLLTLHFRAHPDAAAVRETIAATAGSAAAQSLVFEALAATDWVRQGQESLHPVAAGRFVVHAGHARSRFPANRIAIEIEAGLAFGTGHHGSTRGCLLALDRILKAASAQRRLTWSGRTPARSNGPAPSPACGGGLGRGGTSRLALLRPLPVPPPQAGEGTLWHRSAKSTQASARVATRAHSPKAVLDVGTGTGVLAIAAARARRCPVLASDIDPRAVATARDNARINRVGSALEVIHAAGVAENRFRRRGPFALVFANILLEPLQQMSTPIARLVAPSGRVVLAGLLLGQAAAALASYRARGLVLERRIRCEGWLTLVLARPRRRGKRM